MTIHEKYMERCLSLAALGAGEVSPNPMVGCVIVHRNRIIGEGFHREYGGPHAEVNAIASVARRELLKESDLYVSLEPCAHHGKTPPCSDLIIKSGIRRVIVGTADPFPGVEVRGIEKLQHAGVEVISGILEPECRDLNRRFFTFHEKGRPYIILKWAQSMDGFLDRERSAEERGKPLWISAPLARMVVHRCRSQESAILVGRVTAENDDPALTTRLWSGRNPLRMVIDLSGKLSRQLQIFDQSTPTVVISGQPRTDEENLSFLHAGSDAEIPQLITQYLRKWRKLSLVVEGGRKTLLSFIEAGLWDEAHIYTGRVWFGKGTPSPSIEGTIVAQEWFEDTLLSVMRNPFAQEIPPEQVLNS